ncbi:maltose permease [Ophiostoma piceae UAMH 11346]|uniref:Maltose permease n=1 Tax=Ophiostoma piceae (strain UAMH 11346) TaxID=1262450 RepID=S3CDD1_OPHP1|nr:maltose permease [Ophiostoma piceae UAMH 11346]
MEAAIKHLLGVCKSIDDVVIDDEHMLENIRVGTGCAMMHIVQWHSRDRRPVLYSPTTPNHGNSSIPVLGQMSPVAMNAASESIRTEQKKKSSATSLAGSQDEANLLPHEHLPAADTPFTGVADLFAQFSQAQGKGSDCVIIAPASHKQFLALRNARDKSGRKRCLFYLAEHRTIIVTLPTYEHDSLHIFLSSTLDTCVKQMGLEWFLGTSQTFSPAHLASSGEGDSNGRPIPARLGSSAWPTIVAEAGYTQTVASLRAKMRFWFAASNHDVKIVLLAKAFPQAHDGRILLEQWQERPASVQRPGATMTRRSAQPRLDPACLQTINIVWAGAVPFDQATVAQRRDRSLYNVTRGPLRLAFESLYLRLPVAPHEHDVIFTADMLQRYASLVWAS